MSVLIPSSARKEKRERRKEEGIPRDVGRSEERMRRYLGKDKVISVGVP